MQKQYKMNGKQKIRLSDGRKIKPNSGIFKADLNEAEEKRFILSGAIQVVEPVQRAAVSLVDAKADKKKED